MGEFSHTNWAHSPLESTNRRSILTISCGMKSSRSFSSQRPGKRSMRVTPIKSERRKRLFPPSRRYPSWMRYMTHPLHLAGILLVLPLIVAVQPASAQNGTRPNTDIPRVSRPPKLEDFVDMQPNSELAGQLAKIEGLIQRNPKDGAPSSQRTEVYLGYDDKNFYAIFVCFDSGPGSVRARMVRREDISGDDAVELMLDTFNDQRRAYSFRTNPFGVQLDALFTEGRGDEEAERPGFYPSFDTLWHSRGELTDRGYVVWMAIPFKSLRFPSTPEQTWGLQSPAWLESRQCRILFALGFRPRLRGRGAKFRSDIQEEANDFILRQPSRGHSGHAGVGAHPGRRGRKPQPGDSTHTGAAAGAAPATARAPVAAGTAAGAAGRTLGDAAAEARSRREPCFGAACRPRGGGSQHAGGYPAPGSGATVRRNRRSCANDTGTREQGEPTGEKQ